MAAVESWAGLLARALSLSLSLSLFLSLALSLAHSLSFSLSPCERHKPKAKCYTTRAFSELLADTGASKGAHNCTFSHQVIPGAVLES